MKISGQTLLGLVTFAAIPVFLAQPAIAQVILTDPDAVILAEPDGVREYETIPEAFDEAFFSHDENFYNNRSIPRQLSWLFGFGFPENELYKDGRAINNLYDELLEEQVSTTARIRTPDLENPFGTSLSSTPISELGRREFEDFGFQQPIPAPPRPVAEPPRPIPALW